MEARLDAETLAYEFDEEKLGFEEPPRAARRPLSFAEMSMLTVIAIGVASLIAGLLGGRLSGTWTGLLLSYGAIAVGISGFFWLRFASSSPGIRHDGTTFRSIQARGALGYIAGLLITGFYVLLYWYPSTLERAIAMVDPLALALSGREADHWFFYGFLYTLAILLFAVRMVMKYRHSRYQLLRTASVAFFQLGLAFLLPNLLKALNQPEFYFTYFWPLKPEYLFPHTVADLRQAGALGTFMVFWGAAAIFIATPILTYYFGKRWYCSWVCGCGGLAETLGDPFRQLSDKSTSAWKIERVLIHTVLVLITLLTALLWIDTRSRGALFGGFSESFRRWYGFYIGAIFSGVIGVGFYPLLGSRVWCRFGCPMAAILGIFQRTFSRFRITTNGGQCMSCGNCSTYCEMGIDVRSYAQRGENIVRASCVGCGICSAVCPRGVLKLENGPTHADRFPTAASPLRTLITSIRSMEE